jgi:hypothetical protein
MNLPIGGRYCSMMTVLSGNAFVLERMIGRMDTAVRMVSVIPGSPIKRTHRRCLSCPVSCARRTPRRVSYRLCK